jgi:hypothetical protein
VAQRVHTVLIDDITGKEISEGEGETISFAVEGTEYSIDLDAKNAKKFRDALSFYQDHATKLGRSGVTSIRRGRGGSSRSSSEVDNNAVRKWAEANGYEVSSRGRIKGEIIEAYRAAGN